MDDYTCEMHHCCLVLARRFLAVNSTSRQQWQDCGRTSRGDAPKRHCLQLEANLSCDALHGRRSCAHPEAKTTHCKKIRLHLLSPM
jgi:hypothetical protein